MQTAILQQTQEERSKRLEDKLKKFEAWLTSEELRASRQMLVNVDYWQARLSCISEVREKLKQF